jgi:hypothetical protein
MQDVFGQELAVGDTVAVINPWGKSLIAAKIISIGPKMVRVVWTTPANPSYGFVEKEWFRNAYGSDIAKKG